MHINNIIKCSHLESVIFCFIYTQHRSSRLRFVFLQQVFFLTGLPFFFFGWEKRYFFEEFQLASVGNVAAAAMQQGLLQSATANTDFAEPVQVAAASRSSANLIWPPAFGGCDLTFAIHIICYGDTLDR